MFCMTYDYNKNSGYRKFYLNISPRGYGRKIISAQTDVT